MKLEEKTYFDKENCKGLKIDAKNIDVKLVITTDNIIADGSYAHPVVVIDYRKKTKCKNIVYEVKTTEDAMLIKIDAPNTAVIKAKPKCVIMIAAAEISNTDMYFTNCKITTNMRGFVAPTRMAMYLRKCEGKKKDDYNIIIDGVLNVRFFCLTTDYQTSEIVNRAFMQAEQEFDIVNKTEIADEISEFDLL